MQHEVLGRQEVIALALAAALSGCGGEGGTIRAPVAVDLGGPGRGVDLPLRLVEPLRQVEAEREASAAVAEITWLLDERTARERVRREGRPLLVFGSAAWSLASAQLERGLLADPRIVRASRASVALRVDVTDVDEAQQAVARFRLQVTPTVLVLAPDGAERFRAEGSAAIDADALERALLEE